MLELLNRVVARFNRIVRDPDLAKRAIKTFMQAAVAVLALDEFAGLFSIATWKQAAIAGAAAVASLIQNKVLVPLWDKKVTAKREALIDPHA